MAKHGGAYDRPWTAVPVITWITCAVLLQLGSILADDENIVKDYIEGWVGAHSLIRSPNFPSPYRLDANVYVYHLKCYQEHCYVRVIFTDFDLHDNSVLRIFDGEDTSGPSSIWRRKDRPIFQSSSSSLLLVFKPGRPDSIEKTDNRDDWDPSDYEIENVGFKFNYSFVEEDRNTWSRSTLGVPSQGCCSFTQAADYVHGGAAALLRHPENRFSLCDCAFSMKFESVGFLALTMPNTSWIADGLVSVQSGLTSEGVHQPPTSPVLGQDYRGQGIVLFYSYSREAYVRISAQVTENQFVSFFFYRDSDTAVEFLQTRSRKPKPCAHKTCQHNRCLPYWGPCEDHTDSTCDDLDDWVDSECDHEKRCYNKTTDHCDGYEDCLDGSDETDCPEKEKYDWRSIVIGLSIFLVALVIYGGQRAGVWKSLSNGLSSCLKCLDGCFSRCCSRVESAFDGVRECGGNCCSCECSLECSQVCLCCVTPATSLSPQSTHSTGTETTTEVDTAADSTRTSESPAANVSGTGRGRRPSLERRASAGVAEMLSALDEARRTSFPGTGEPPSYRDVSRNAPSTSGPDLSDLSFSSTSDRSVMRMPATDSEAPPPSYDEAVTRYPSSPSGPEAPPSYESIV